MNNLLCVPVDNIFSMSIFQVLTKFVEYNYEYLLPQVVHIVEVVYIWSHQQHTPDICKACRLPTCLRDHLAICVSRLKTQIL